MLQQNPDKVIALVQSSTRNIMNSFKVDFLRQCHKDIKLLIRAGYDKKITYKIRLDNAISLESSIIRYSNLKIDFAKSGD
jgi:hypothetical protein